MNPISHRIHPDPKDCRRLLLDDGRPVLGVIGGGHERPFTAHELATISAWICECWNAHSVAQPPNDKGKRTAEGGPLDPQVVPHCLASPPGIEPRPAP